MNDYKAEELHIEFEDANYVCSKRVVDDQPQWSFDQCRTWHATMGQAFIHAKEQGSLFKVGEVAGTSDAEEFHGFLIGFVDEMQDLKPGESLRVLRDQTSFVVVKEQTVIAIRASTVTEVDLKMEKQQ